MSPSLPAQARAAGQRITNDAQKSKPATWRCHECGASGVQPTKKAAQHAWDHHWIAQHQGVDF